MLRWVRTSKESMCQYASAGTKRPLSKRNAKFIIWLTNLLTLACEFVPYMMDILTASELLIWTLQTIPSCFCRTHCSKMVVWNWIGFKPLEQNFLRRLLQGVVERSPTLSIGISLHSMRRGGCFYRVFDSTERKFNFRELMAWCRWEDAKTCCEYLVTKSISDKIDPRNLLRMKAPNHTGVDSVVSVLENWEFVLDEIRKCIREEMSARYGKKNEPTVRHQLSIKEYVTPKGIPTARNASDAWSQWFMAEPKKGLFSAIKDFSREMIKIDRKRYSERHTLGQAFTKYVDLVQFEAAYAGHTSSYSCLLKEVRKRKREGRL